MINTQIFIFRIGSLGDSIVALPAIKKVYEYYNKSLYLITNKPMSGIISAWEIYKHTYFFENVFEFENNIQGIMNLRQYIIRKKGKKILYYFVDESSFKRNFKNYLFFKFIGFDEIYGWKECIGKYIKIDKDRKLLEVEPEYKRLEKIVNKYLGLEENKDFEYNFFNYNLKFIKECKQKFNFLNKKFIVLGIGGKTKIQRWNIENYIYILNKINENFIVVILGGKSEIKEAEVVKNKVNKTVINLCGQTSILESSYILKNSICYFGNDTGTAHLAGIVGTKVFVISSARDNINRWYPYGKNHIIIRKRVECEGCWLHKDICKYDIKCLNGIDKYEVINKLLVILNFEKIGVI